MIWKPLLESLSGGQALTAEVGQESITTILFFVTQAFIIFMKKHRSRLMHLKSHVSMHGCKQSFCFPEQTCALTYPFAGATWLAAAG